MAREVFTVGGLWRGSVRRALRAWDIDFTEDKGWLDSQFVVRGERETLDRLMTTLREWAASAE